MRILMLHNLYQVRGGEDESTDLEAALLRQYNHEVDLMLFDNREIARGNLLGVGLESVWSQAAYRRVAQQLLEKEYDLDYIQNFFPLISLARPGFPKIPLLQLVSPVRINLSCIHGFQQRYRVRLSG